jgi:DNA replication and repair protein RecF
LAIPESSPDNAPHVASVSLTDFRNYARQVVELSPGLNVIAGPNAQGKTNFLEAIHLLSTTRLLRGMRDAEAVREGAKRAVVEAELGHVSTKIGIILEAGIRKRAQLNGMNLPRAADLIGRLPSVCISAADMEIVRGEPADRRMFLDIEISQLYPAYLDHLTHYKRALDQRNALLRNSQEFLQPTELFEPWEEQIAHHGAALREYRQRFVADIEPLASRHHGFMGDGEVLTVTYAPRDEAGSPLELMEALASGRSSDVHRGGTGVGPHRDELLVQTAGRDARLFGSQGQQRTAVISLKLGVLQHAAEHLGASPVLLLDDILSDLDERRRAMLIELVLAASGQCLLTCTEASAAGDEVLDRARIFTVRAGHITG